MSDTRYILFKGGMQPKNPMAATKDKIKEISSVGYKQGKDFDIVSWKVLQEALGGKKFAHGGMMNMNEMIRPLGYAAGGPIPKEEPDLTYDQVVEMLSADKSSAKEPSPFGLIGGTQKWLAEKYPVNPLTEMKDNLIDKGKIAIKGLGSKSIDVLRQLLGSKSAEAGVYIPDETLDKMSIDEIIREIELLGPPGFGMSVGPNYIQHLRDLANALEKKIGD